MTSGYERTPWWMFWAPPWRKKVMIYGDLRLFLDRNWDWVYAEEPTP